MAANKFAKQFCFPDLDFLKQQNAPYTCSHKLQTPLITSAYKKKQNAWYQETITFISSQILDNHLSKFGSGLLLFHSAMCNKVVKHFTFTIRNKIIF